VQIFLKFYSGIAVPSGRPGRWRLQPSFSAKTVCVFAHDAGQDGGDCDEAQAFFIF
jgi:hypothetical protein